jgi:beta-galactosidase
VVDHEGTENTRVFADVADVGKRLAAMDGVVGCSTPAAVALIYDWNVRWALDDVKGLLHEKTGYEQTILDHYAAFWRQGVSVDIIDSRRSFDGYDLLAAPMLYMLRPGVAEKIDRFVQRGGTFVATYVTGYADESDLCFLDGFPGPLKETLGIWCEEIDSLYPGDTNALVWNGKNYAVKDFCELIHLRGAEALGTYRADFYAGRPALTVNKRGEGTAYFIAARTGADFLFDFYCALVDERRIKRALGTPLPPGVTAQVRSDGTTGYVFVMNFTPSPATVGSLTLAPYEVRLMAG